MHGWASFVEVSNIDLYFAVSLKLYLFSFVLLRRLRHLTTRVHCTRRLMRFSRYIQSQFVQRAVIFSSNVLPTVVVYRPKAHPFEEFRVKRTPCGCIIWLLFAPVRLLAGQARLANKQVVSYAASDAAIKEPNVKACGQDCTYCIVVDLSRTESSWAQDFTKAVQFSRLSA